MAMLHAQSSAVEVFRVTSATKHLMTYKEGDGLNEIVKKLAPIIKDFQQEAFWDINIAPLEKYTSKTSAEVLVAAMNEVLEQKGN
jgi:cell division inhibitor SulA